MKQTTLVKLLTGGAACALALGTAFAQESSTTTTTTDGATGVSATTATGTSDVSASTTTTSSLNGTGTITTFTPGSDFIMFRSQASAEPMKYYYTKSTTVVDPEGKTVEFSALRPDMPVTYTYTKEGDRMVITKVTLEKPITYYEKKESTTTTTTTP